MFFIFKTIPTKKKKMGQTFYFSLCAFNALLEMFLQVFWIELGVKLCATNRIRKFCNFFYTGLAFPASAVSLRIISTTTK